MNALNNRNSTCSTLSTGSDKSLAHMTSNSYVTSSLLSTCSSSSSASSTSSSSTTTSASIAYQHDNDSGLSLTRDYSASSNCQVTTGDNGADSLSSGHDSIDNASTTSSSSRHVSLIGQRESCT
ncbi:hypothetical protein HDE_13205 [Halotydeus destructor]|nr:hypothetical protein HDE_13205 [Halotydeus destructor]